ncbi:MAG TPA: phosphatase PAP2 family protein [Rhizomicrobium sp.]|jgi:membrane-associated phospholipid phosphatase|nr:phosphatase PAP2 family protein [Rhizomicrobium sp.]
MLLWLGLALIVLGAAAFAVDRPVAHFFYEHASFGFRRFCQRTTDLAKGGHWLVVACVAFLIAQGALAFKICEPAAHVIATYSLAFLASLAAGSAVLHALKIMMGRRRPRDEFEHSLYGFKFFTFDTQYDSFPSGHALTIFCVASVACCAWPLLAVLWLALALWLALTRMFLTSHFLSDILIGAGVGVLASREVIVNIFPALAPGWL